ncbi:hypothetical protein FA13DRAFT_1721219 [Coprinellus micaceus]|uniref:Uncharacterized protein n=1 Tax=Coprinellus micaceus TaxID=71717 RepID=A0A4Y7S1Z8_COPMI|nr:hypothetical protein FA13DRAFT_1721219 [Coprinellus micaceus]
MSSGRKRWRGDEDGIEVHPGREMIEAMEGLVWFPLVFEVSVISPMLNSVKGEPQAWRGAAKTNSSVGRLTVSPLSVYEGSAGVPPAHRVGVVVVAGHGKGNRVDGSTGRAAHCAQATVDNSGVSVDGLVSTAGGSVDGSTGRAVPLCTGNSGQQRQQWTTAVGRLTGLGKHGWWVSRRIHWQRPSHCAQATADNSGGSVDGFREARLVGQSTDPLAETVHCAQATADNSGVSVDGFREAGWWATADNSGGRRRV